MNGRFEAICVGESMALVIPDPPRPLALGGTTRLDVAGAESTVAAYLAQLGVRAAWASRVGDDPLGCLVRDRVAGYGVDVGLVQVDPAARTGVFFKDPGARGGANPAGTTVHYYRDGSAASRLGPELLDHPAFVGCRLVHFTGITVALSTGCAALVERALVERPAGAATHSFDVNHRPGLWPAERAGPPLARLANRADVVFVGLDEAARLWGTGTADEVRALLPGPETLIVKDGPVGATSFGPAGRTFVPALEVEIREPVGAGDAFAAGYLFGRLRGLPEARRLRLGHLVARTAMGVTTDVGRLPPLAELLADVTRNPPMTDTDPERRP